MLNFNSIKLYLDINFSESQVWFMVLNATFNNISVISWQSVLLVEETRVPGEKYHLSVTITSVTPMVDAMRAICHEGAVMVMIIWFMICDRPFYWWRKPEYP
jgi:hypothetical protein